MKETEYKEWSYVWVKSILKDGSFASKREELGIVLPNKLKGYARVFYTNSGTIVNLPIDIDFLNLIRKK